MIELEFMSQGKGDNGVCVIHQQRVEISTQNGAQEIA